MSTTNGNGSHVRPIKQWEATVLVQRTRRLLKGAKTDAPLVFVTKELSMVMRSWAAREAIRTGDVHCRDAGRYFRQMLREIEGANSV